MARTEHAGPYVDQALTQRGPFVQTGADPDPLEDNKLGETRVYDVAGTVRDASTLASRDPAAKQPNSWIKNRDPYANGGGAGQSFLNNQAAS